MKPSRFAICVVAVMTLLAARAANAGPLDCLPDEDSNFARPPNPSLRSAVVFVHGLHGDVRNTWKATQGGAPVAAWPCLVLDDTATFAPSNVYLAGYRSKPFEGNPDTTTAARRLAAELRARTGVFGHAHVTLVAHSMGGLVVARMLTTPDLLTQDQLRRIRLVVFMGTPAQPTEAAAVCGYFGMNDQCTEMSNRAEMEALWRKWDALAERPPAWCIAEGDNTWFPRWGWPPWSLRIVPVESAYRPCRDTEGRDTIDGRDHSSLVKPEGRGTDPHRFLRVAFAACVQPHIQDLRPDVALAERVSAWYHALGQRVAAGGSGADVALSESLDGAGAEGVQYWLPKDPGQPVGQRAELELKPAPWMVRELRNQAAMLFAGVHWVDRVSSLRQRLADGEMEALVDAMASAGRLRPDDVVLAVDAGRSLPFLPLLLLRPLEQGSPAGARFGVLGFLGVRLLQPPDCGAKATRVADAAR